MNKNLTVKVTYKDKETEEIFDMLFGNSYKDWKTQKKEYESTFPNEEALSVKKSKQKWIGWGGLKWCQYKNLQHQLNREGCQEKEPDNPNPRKAEDFVFI